MDAEQVVRCVQGLTDAGVRVWVGGGWGVDALVGRQTRDHHDLDLALDADRFDEVLAGLLAEGFGVATDWRPVRLELAHLDGRRVDLHPLTIAADGTARQPGLDGATFEYPADAFAVGRVADHPVLCLSLAQQERFHSGYDPRPQDLHDLALLRSLRASAPSGTP